MLYVFSAYGFVASALLGALPITCMLGCSKTLNQSEMRGASLYTMHCYDCHEENQLGLKKVPPKLHRLFSSRFLPDGSTPATDESVRDVIVNGKRTMPAFSGRLSDRQIADLIAYLHRK